MITAHTGLNLADWGFLWYGEWLTRVGEIPLRDFQSYDPGRYYFLAAVSFVFGEGVVGTREALALVQWIGITAALCLLRRAGGSWTVTSACGFVLVWWMVPEHKMFEASLSLLAVSVAFYMAAHATPRAYFLAGTYVGVAALFGRNHGLYALLAFICILIFLRFKENRLVSMERIASFTAGIVAGYSPLWIACIIVPGFFHAMVESVRVIFAHGTNLPLPIPWPWRVHYSGLSVLSALFGLTVGLCFILAYFETATAILFLLASRWKPDDRRLLLLACAFVGAFYLHHASVRATIQHFSQATPPLVLLAFVVFLKAPRYVKSSTLALGLMIATFSVLRAQPVVQRALEGNWVQRAIEGDRIWISPSDATVLDSVVRFDKTYNPQAAPILLTPIIPTLYRILRRRSPTWEIYFLIPASPAADAAAVRSLRSSGAPFAIVGDIPIDQRDTLRFRNIYPELYAYIQRTYRKVNDFTLAPPYQAYEKVRSTAATQQP